MVAGEASGDRHGAELARALNALNSDRPIFVFGAGGEEMRAAGVRTLVDARDVAIMGIPEIASALTRLYRAYRNLLTAALSEKPDAIVLIDWPDFNLRLAKRLHQYGFKIVYYISPQVWAWRTYRVRAIKRLVERMLVILPFERDFYRTFGVDVEYVGHPLLEAVRITSTRAEFTARHGLDPLRPIVALLPGSREKEIHYHVPPMLSAVATLANSDIAWGEVAGLGELAGTNAALKSKPQFVLPVASTVNRHSVESLITESAAEVTIVERDTYNAVGHSCFAIVASGTATIETAILGVPMVIVYKGSELNWRIIRPLIHLDTFGMANLIAGKNIVPELIQHELTGPAIADAVIGIAGDPAKLAQMRTNLAEVRRRLEIGGERPADRAARAIMQMVRS